MVFCGATMLTCPSKGYHADGKSCMETVHAVTLWSVPCPAVAVAADDHTDAGLRSYCCKSCAVPVQGAAARAQLCSRFILCRLCALLCLGPTGPLCHPGQPC